MDKKYAEAGGGLIKDLRGKLSKVTAQPICFVACSLVAPLST